MKWCIVTTSADKSLNFFLQDTSKFQSETLLFGERVPASLANQTIDVVYFRDPFNGTTYSLDEIKKTVAAVRSAFPKAYYVDGATGIGRLLIEDKWQQYKLLKAYMPSTRLVKDREKIGSAELLKKRISSRGRGVRLGPQVVEGNAEKYIAQRRYQILKEYRVYLIAGIPLPKSAERSSKHTAAARVRTIRLVKTPEELHRFARQIATELGGYDFLGMDIVRTTEGLKLLEVNRAPQFSRFSELSGTNIAFQLMNTVAKQVKNSGNY